MGLFGLQSVEFCLGICYGGYVADVNVIETLTVTVSFAVVVSLKFTLESNVPDPGVADHPIKIPHSRIVVFPTSALEKNLSRYATLSV